MKPENTQDVNSRDRDRRPLPSNLSAEQIVLGGIFMSDESYDVVAEILAPDHFFDPIHAKIYASIEELLSRGQKATPVTLLPYFENVSMRGGQSMAEYLASLAVAGAPMRAIKSYAQTVYDCALRRQLIQTGKELSDTAYDLPVATTPIQLIEKAEQDLYTIAEAKHEVSTVTFNKALSVVVKDAMAAMQKGGFDSGLSTGQLDLNAKLGGGLHPGQLIIVAGRPGMGKTALATNFGYRSAKRLRLAQESLQKGEELKDRSGVPVGFFSLEMTAEELSRRVLAQESRVPANSIQAGTFSPAEADAILEAHDRIAQTQFLIDPTGGISIARLAMRALRMKRQFGIGLLIIDYLQLVTASRRAGDNRVQEIGEISSSLKQLAKELEVPVVALSQLSRKVEEREDKRPNMSDLRDGGTIEQDADVILFPYRHEYYWRKANPEPVSPFERADWEAKLKDEGCAGLGEINIAKQRNGPTDTVRVSWDGDFTSFYDLGRKG